MFQRVLNTLLNTITIIVITHINAEAALHTCSYQRCSENMQICLPDVILLK